MFDTFLNEYISWMSKWGPGRNDEGLRFGQYLTNKYGRFDPDIFYVESAYDTWDLIASDMINEY